MTRALRRVYSWLFLAALFFPVRPARAQSAPASRKSPPSLEERIAAITGRPEFRHSHFGIEFFSLDDGSVVYAENPQKLFVPASTTKLLTLGTALELLGADYRFHTRVYHTGTLGSDGTLTGDVILVASGDPNLSNRIQSDGSLAFENHDHAYGGSPDTRAVPGDPLAVIRELAGQIARKGVRLIRGRVLVDISLYPEGTREGGTGVVVSPIIVNDNVIDVTLAPGAAEGAPASLSASPATTYAAFINLVKTGPAGSRMDLDIPTDVANPDGTHVVTVTGNMPVGTPPILFAYAVPQPSRFAEITLREALAGLSVSVEPPAGAQPPDFKLLAASYTDQRLLAEHVSPPFSEEVKVTLKVSQNLHASMMPYLLSAVRGAADSAPQPGFDAEHAFLTRAGLDLTGAMQSDGAGGLAEFTPDFMVHFLTYMASRPDYPVYLHALPILGRDGTLARIQTQSPAAGHVFAKTGTYVNSDALNRAQLVTGKGLAGYITTADGRHLVFAAYFNNVAVPAGASGVEGVGQALGEIAAAVYGTTAQRAEVGAPGRQ